MWEHSLVSESIAHANPETILCQEFDEYDDDSTQEEINMTTAKTTTTSKKNDTEINVQAALHQMVGGISQFPLQNVLQGMAQSLVREVGRARFFADRIELGDDALHDQHGNRPQMDQDEYHRTLSERQMEILVQAQDDEAALIAALVEVKNFYTWMFHDQSLVYTLVEDGRGGWKQVTDFNEAVEIEYRKAHQSWLRRQHTAQQEGFTPEGAQAARDAAKQRASKLAAQL